MTDAEFGEAYRLHKDSVYRYARRMTGSAAVAEDAVQECFLLLWHKSAYQPDRGTLRGFLFGVARNLVLQRIRQERNWSELDEESSSIAPLDAAGLGRAGTIARAVGALPPLQREAIILAEYEEMSLEEIGRATQAELAAVKSRLHRARVNLRRMLAPLMDGKREEYGIRSD